MSGSNCEFYTECDGSSGVTVTHTYITCA